MKILLVNTFYYPNMPGGAEQSVKLLAEGLASRGHEVAVFCADSKDGKEEITEHNGVKIYRFTTHKFNLYKFSYEKNKVGKIEKIRQKILSMHNSKSVEDFINVCKEFKPDIIHTNTLFGISDGLVWKKSKQLGIPVVHTVRDIGIISPVRYGHKANTFLKQIHLIRSRHITSCVTAVTSPSNYTLSTTLETGCFKNARIKKCIFNSVKIDYDGLKKIIEEKRARTNEKVKYMYAGRLVYFKGIEHMIEAFEQMKNKNSELHICGTGEMQKFVEDWAQKDKRILYHGKLNNEQLADCYKESDVVLVPSYWPEPFGRVLIEANMYGSPVIAGNCGGMPEIVEHTKAGKLYEPKNTKELIEKMDEMHDRNSIKSYYDAIEKNISVYDIKYQIDAFEKLYIDLTKKEETI